MAAVNSSWNVPVAHSPEKAQESRLYIPRLKLNLPYAAGDESVLNDAIWHRYPERGDPERGGNFILAGHRFEMGLTPGETRHKSPLYHIDKLQKDDFLYVDFKGKRYAYKVIERLTVAPNQTAIEAASTEPKLTLYTCTFKGASDGREVILAQLVERDIPLDQEL